MVERGTCEVWWARLDQFHPAQLSDLSSVERARRADYHRPPDRDRFTVAAVLLRRVVARETGLAARDVGVDRTCPDCAKPHGRPQLPGLELQVSVSHSGYLIVLAVARDRRVGVDVERITTVDFRPMLELVQAPGEPPVDTAAEFFRLWTRKESVLKATGQGLRVAMNTLVVPVPGTTTIDLRPPDGAPFGSTGGSPGGATGGLQDTYCAALTLVGTGTLRLHDRDAEELLGGRRYDRRRRAEGGDRR